MSTFVAGLASASMSTKWKAFYDGPVHSHDSATGVAVDSLGNTIVTGVSYGGPTARDDLATIKYSPDGNVIWKRRYDGPGNAQEKSSAIAVDGSDNVLVLGRSYAGSLFYNDYALMKYSPTGNRQWVANDDGLANLVDIPLAMAVDGNGSIYVAGTSVNADQVHTQMVTMKFSPTGVRQWIRTITGPLANQSSVAYGIAVNAAGAVAVTGEVSDPSGVSGYLVVQYGTGGGLQWTGTYTSAAGGHSRPTAMAIDGTSNVLVTGWAGRGAGPSDYATVKFDTAGNQLWARTYNGSGNGSDEANSIATDTAGNVFVTGESSNGLTGDFVTIKYDAAGHRKWVKSLDLGDRDRGLFVRTDASGNVVVLGQIVGSSSGDFMTVAYTTNGIKLWSKRFDGPLGNDDTPTGLAVAADGSVHVTGGAYMKTGYLDFATLKY